MKTQPSLCRLCRAPAVLLVFVLMTMQKFAAVIGAGVTIALMGPYVAWASFATALTYAIMRLNPQASSLHGAHMHASCITRCP